MGMQTPITTSFNLPDGREVVIETGKLATQADGSVVVKVGKTMLFCSVVSAHKEREGQSFFPLSVDYQEKFASVGRIPGNFFRREARLSDYEILTSRLVDRAIRPLFPKGYMFDTQVIINLMSGDKEELPDAYAALAASAAIAVSDIPFATPIAEVRVGKIDGVYVVNPSRTALENATLNIIVAASNDNVMMVEGDSKEISEAELIEAIKVGHEAIKIMVAAQVELAKLVGEKASVKRELVPAEESEEVESMVEKYGKTGIYDMAKSFLDKKTRKARIKEVEEEVIAKITEEKGEEFVEENGSLIGTYFDKMKKEVIREMVMAESVRLDGRKLDEVRPIWTEVDYLPAAHGSAIFNRGETQALVTATLGTKLDSMMIDNALINYYEKFILHYNFPAYSVGETRPMRGPGRREVGHANLAGRSLKQVLPEENAYTLRLVSDIMESNGSSSMATVCGGSLALMDAGVKLKAPVSGIAMGLISDGTRHAVLTDILGDEDALGDMDFKVTGTEKGITACQMDIKIEGLSYDLLEKALDQAKEGRLHILNEMAKTLAEPREDFKPHAPRIVEVIIDKSFIGGVIGPGGAVIREMQEESGAVISVEEVGNTGVINIASSNKDSIDMVLARIKQITFTPEVGEVYEGVVKSVVPFGAFVEFSGKSGLLHVSEISYTRIENVEDVYKEGDTVKVKILEIDQRSGKIRLSRKALMDPPEGYVERPRRDDRRRDDRRGGRRDDRRGGGRDNRNRRY